MFDDSMMMENMDDLSGDQKMVLTLAAAGAVAGASKMLNEAADLKKNYKDTPLEEYFKDKYSGNKKRKITDQEFELPKSIDPLENHFKGLSRPRVGPRMAKQLANKMSDNKMHYKFNSFQTNKHFNTHTIYKPTNLTSSKLMGFSGQSDFGVPKYNSAVTLPLEVLEFWVGDNTNPNVEHSKGSMALKNSECMIASMKLKLSNLQILEDTELDHTGVAISSSRNVNEVSSYIIPVESHLGANANGALCKIFSENTSIQDDTSDAVTTKDMMMGKLVTKSTEDRLNLNPHNMLWTPGDNPIELEFTDMNGTWFIMPELENGKYHLLPMESGMGNNTTDTYEMPSNDERGNFISNTSSRTPTSSTLGSLLIGVPFVLDANGQPKNYRVAFSMEQEVLLVSRSEWMQNNSAANWNSNLGVRLAPRSTQISKFRHMVGPYHFPEDGHPNLKTHHTNE
uniref:Polyhedrin n=1 Tax=Penaeus monodon nucleopolyhedrovirus TaxID=259389 RepID=I7C3J6_9BACU|nr:polyhedrin [Penaeus monodon nucleopolyhedrovirus]